MPSITRTARWIYHFCLANLLFAFCFPLHTAEVWIESYTIRQDGEEERIPTRLHVVDSNGKPVPPSDNQVYWRDHVSGNGRVQFNLESGDYTVDVERGPEWTKLRTLFSVSDVNPSGPRTHRFHLKRITDLTSEGWWSGETHIHRSIERAEELMAAEDLWFGNFITWWNAANPWKDSGPPSPGEVKLPGGRFAFFLGGEDERDGGALLYLGLDRPLSIAEASRYHPPSAHFALGNRMGWIDIEKPFWWDFPVWIALGIGDTVGIANNHMQRGGVLGNEAWGKARNLDRYPGAHGNGWWTQEIYYHLLNSGHRLPPSAGAASGVLPNPVGYNRIFAKLDGIVSWDAWRKAIKSGRVFVSNGPLLRVQANGTDPGHVFKSEATSLSIELDGKVDSNEPIDRLELVRNGSAEPISLPSRIQVEESGWFLIRAIGAATNTLRFGSTGPFYVELAKKPELKRQYASAKFFDQWCDEAIAKNEAAPISTEANRAEVLDYWKRGKHHWTQVLLKAPQMTSVEATVVDFDTGMRLAARVYLSDAKGNQYFVETALASGQAVRYSKQNWINAGSVEKHTTVSAHPFRATLDPGSYELVVEKGKEYVPSTNRFEIAVGSARNEMTIRLKRMVNVSKLGWFSGETHTHRGLEELPLLQTAEDLNVSFPLTAWVTRGFQAPAQGDKTPRQALAEDLVQIDDTHVFWPRNTEWEIFTITNKPHTSGAVFALGHKGMMSEGMPPVGRAIQKALDAGAIVDMDKHDWPWSMTLPSSANAQLYELANNHMWRTQFAFTNWNHPSPEWMRPQVKETTGGERDWILFTLENYYALLNCGLQLLPSAGTASGVHPVPLGFGRVYVHLPGGFEYSRWKAGLLNGNSFVTTGPLLLAHINGKVPGERFEWDGKGTNLILRGEVISTHPIPFIEVLENGVPFLTIMGRNDPLNGGGYRTEFQRQLVSTNSGWFAVRAWEDSGFGRTRFAHTAPWYVDLAGVPPAPRSEEKDYLIQRIQKEIDRSRMILPPDAIKEYEVALNRFQSLKPSPEPSDTSQQRGAPTVSNALDWYANMKVHGFRRPEMTSVLGSEWIKKLESDPELFTKLSQSFVYASTNTTGGLKVLPYPGGRHPRMGFFDGAMAALRETKLSVFSPWDPESYVVVDVPEAIWSNLGLTYLAHTHIATVWDLQGAKLDPLEWIRSSTGGYTLTRRLPNGIAFGVEAKAKEGVFHMTMSLTNGTAATLSDLRIQHCVMLKGARHFNAQSRLNKKLSKPFSSVVAFDSRRWIITAWTGCDRVWENPPVPCIHSDPKFPDLVPGQSATLKGWLWFYEGEKVDEELERLRREYF